MLPNALFKPLNLQHLIEETERAYGAHGLVDLLVAALTDRRIKRDDDIDTYLETLKVACRQTRRHQELIPVLKRIGVLNPSRRPEMAAELALVHAHLKDRAKGVALLESTLAEQLRRPARRRSLAFCVAGEIAAAVLGKPALAREIAALGRAVMVALSASEATVWAEPLLFSLDEPSVAESSFAESSMTEFPQVVGAEVLGAGVADIDVPGSRPRSRGHLVLVGAA
jgi:hypothetical protein